MKLQGPEWNAPGGNWFPFAKQRVAVVITSLAPSFLTKTSDGSLLFSCFFIICFLNKEPLLLLSTFTSDHQVTFVSINLISYCAQQ